MLSFFGRLILIWNRGIWSLKDKINASKDGWMRQIYITSYYMRLDRKGSYIGHDAKFKGIPVFPHGLNSIFISGGTVIGKNCVIFQQVTIGSNTLVDSKGRGAPIIGDNCYIGAGAKIIGNVKIGDNCRIGANCVVYKDMPDSTVAVLSPTRFIQKENLDNRYISQRNGEWVYYNDGEWQKDPSIKDILQSE